MDFPVEATVHLNIFPNKSMVRNILKSHGFELTDLPNNQVRVKGSFLKLKAARASLEQLLNPQTKTETRPSSSSPASSGAISKYYNTNGERVRSESRNKLPYPPPWSTPTAVHEASSTIRPVSPEYIDATSSRPTQHGSFRSGKESFSVDADVFEYADKLRKKDIDLILQSHNVIIQVNDVTEESCCVTLMGKNAKTAVSKLQSLLDDLNKSLRTQDVYLKDMDRGGQALWEKIKNSRHICCSVLVSQRNDRLHLIGSSRESYELKQRLLGNSAEQSGRTGRTLDKNSRQRSSSLPPINRRGTDRDKGANANLSPAGAAGYSPAKYQDDKQNHFKPERAAAAGPGLGNMSRRRSSSESRTKTQPERPLKGYMQDTEKKVQSAESPQGIKQLMNFNAESIKQKFKRITKKKNEK
ncbi:RNA-binding protein 43 [Halichoeres trimaculatus]|uniref:RNA-binding protein 43 n=1 Tax=Halichoeres trimaculatus TaxID=147232 RepID=UPI003D9DE6B6